jgi:hypothetical protein
MNEVTRILSEIEPGDPRVADPRLPLAACRLTIADFIGPVRSGCRSSGDTFDNMLGGVGFTRRHEPILLMRFLEM